MTTMQLDTSSAAVVKGDVVALVVDINGLALVTKAVPAALAVAGRAYAVAVESVAPGARGRFTRESRIDASTTGLTAAAASFARVSSAARIERVATYSTGDLPLGTVDTRGVTYWAPEAAIHAGVTVSGSATVEIASGVARLPAGLVERFLAPDGTADQRSALQALITAAGADWAADPTTETARRQRIVHVGAGVVVLSGPIDVPSGVLIECDRQTRFRRHASWSPIVGLADDPDTYVFGFRSTISGSNTTTTAARVDGGATTFTTAGALPGVGWYAIVSNNAIADGGQTTGSGITRTEVFKVTAGSGTGPYTREGGFEGTHGAGAAIRAVSSVVTDAGITGAGDLAFEGGTVAVGVSFLGAVRCTFDVVAAGFSRAAVERYLGTALTDGRLHVRGECNAGVLDNSAHASASRITSVKGGTLARVHPNGVPRAGYVAIQRSHNNHVTGDLRGFVGGAELKGFCNGFFDCLVDDSDATERVSRDTTLLRGADATTKLVGAGVNFNVNPSSPANDAEIPFGSTVNVRIVNARVPSALNWQGSVSMCDAAGVTFGTIEIINPGRSPVTSGAAMRGVINLDNSVFGHQKIRRLICKGVESAIVLYNTNRFQIDVMDWDPTSANGVTVATVLLLFGHQVATAAECRINTLNLVDAPAHLMAQMSESGVSVDWTTLRDISIGAMQLANGAAWDEVRWCLDVGGLADFGGTRGDVVEVRKPLAVTLESGGDLFTVVSGIHDLPNRTPLYIRGSGLPGNYTSGTIMYVRDSDRATTNTTFKLAATIAGGVHNFSSNGTGLEVQTPFPCVTTPTHTGSYDKGTLVTGVGFGAGLSLPTRFYAVAFGRRTEARIGTEQAFAGDRVRAAVGSRVAVVDNAAAVADVLGVVTGAKAGGSAGRAQIRRAS